MSCPRCNGNIIRDGEDLACLQCGRRLYFTPKPQLAIEDVEFPDLEKYEYRPPSPIQDACMEVLIDHLGQWMRTAHIAVRIKRNPKQANDTLRTMYQNGLIERMKDLERFWNWRVTQRNKGAGA